MMLQLVIWDDVAVACDANLSAEGVDGLGGHTTPPQASKRQQPAGTMRAIRQDKLMEGVQA